MSAEDEDVVLAGSALHTHLVSSGFYDIELGGEAIAHTDNDSDEASDFVDEPELGIWFQQAKNKIFPPSSSQGLTQKCVDDVLDSGLLVAEDEQFFHQYLAGSDSHDKRIPASALMEGLLLASFLAGQRILRRSGFLVASIGVGSLLCLRLGSRIVQASQAGRVRSMMARMIERMEQLKILLGRSLNLIRGMEMINKTSIMVSKLGKAETQSNKQQSRLEAFQRRSLLIPLRQAVYSSSYQMIIYLRAGVQELISTAPLASYIDYKGQYLAFIDMQHYGLEERVGDDRITVTLLKDIIHLYLLQQSEYLRRVTLGIFTIQVKHIEIMADYVGTAVQRLGDILDYQEALKVTTEIPNTKLQAPHKTLHSTVLHLHTCLVMVRNMQDLSHHNLEEEESSKEHLADLLKGLTEIQSELKNCQEVLDDGIKNISSATELKSDAEIVETNVLDVPPPKCEIRSHKKVLSETETVDHFDEVFEAYIPYGTLISTMCGNGVEEEDKKNGKKNKQSRKVLKELKTVLVSKQKEWEVREARALARQNGEAYDETVSEVVKQEEDNSDNNREEDINPAVDFSDSSCSDSESCMEMLGKTKMFRRPMRPAAIKLPNTGGWQEEKYTRQINTQPVGFDSRLAEAAVARCMEMRTDYSKTDRGGEECFGESDSSSGDI